MANLKYFDETVYGNLFADIKNNIDYKNKRIRSPSR